MAVADITAAEPQLPHKPQDGDDGNATESEAEEAVVATRRVTRTRTSLLQRDGSDSDNSERLAPRTRRQRATQGSGGKAASAKAGEWKKVKKKGRGRPPKRSEKSDSESDDSAPGDYVNVQVGDCVLLDSGDADNSFIALVSSVQRSQTHASQPGTFTAQWYYKPDDVRAEVRDLIAGGVLEREVFLSPHKDKNSIDAVLGLCNVVSPEEFEEVQAEISRGFREKTKPFFICRYKYYPGRPIKKALEVVKNDAIRSHLGPMKPKVGEHFQASVPAFAEPSPPLPEAAAATPGATCADVPPWKTPSPRSALRCRQVWSPLVPEYQNDGLLQFLQMLKPVRFSVGNVLKLFRRQDALVEAAGHVRCIVLSYAPSEHVQVCLSTGSVQAVLPSDLCSPLGDDVALARFYDARFNVCSAILGCAGEIERAQQLERDAFRKEVAEFAQLATRRKQEQALAVEAMELYTEEDDGDEDDGEDDDDDEADEAERLATRKRRK